MSNSKSTTRTPHGGEVRVAPRCDAELKTVQRTLGCKPSNEVLGRALEQAKAVQVKTAIAATLLIPFDHELKLAHLNELVNRAWVAKPEEMAKADHDYPVGTEKYLRKILDTAIAELSRADLLLYILNPVAAKLGYALDVIHHARIYETLNRRPVDPLALIVIAEQALRRHANVSPAAGDFLDCLSPPAALA